MTVVSFQCGDCGAVRRSLSDGSMPECACYTAAATPTGTGHEIVVKWDRDTWTYGLECLWALDDPNRPCLADDDDEYAGTYCNWVEWWDNSDHPIEQCTVEVARIPVTAAKWTPYDCFEFSIVPVDPHPPAVQ